MTKTDESRPDAASPPEGAEIERLIRNLEEASRLLGGVGAPAAPAFGKAAPDKLAPRESPVAPHVLLNAASAAPPSAAASAASGEAPPKAPRVIPFIDDWAEEPGLAPANPLFKAKAAPSPSQIAARVKRSFAASAEKKRPRSWRLAALAAGVLGLLCVGAVTLNGRLRTVFADQTQEAAAGIQARIASRDELNVSRLKIIGRDNVPLEEIRAAMGLPEGGRVSAIGFDAAKARAKLLESPWIKEAEVWLDDSGEAAAKIVERVPAAVWQVSGEYWLIEENGGKIIRVENPSARPDLPWIVGRGAEAGVSEVWRLAQAAPPPLAERIGAFTRVGERRWDLELIDGRRIKLPETEPLEAMRALGENIRRNPLFMDMAFETLDATNLREGMVVGLGPEAQAMRDEAAGIKPPAGTRKK